MSKSAQNKLGLSKLIVNRNYYTQAMYRQYSAWILDEEESISFKNKWREHVFNSPSTKKLNIEIGPGAGNFFTHLSTHYLDQLFIAIELKYKPIIQTAEKLKKQNCTNAKVLRYNAYLLDNIFSPQEINNVYIYFPDPWPKNKHHKHRLINKEFLNKLYKLQTKNSFIEIKTDHEHYFRKIHNAFKNSDYNIINYSEDLYKNKTLSEPQFTTNFEKIFIKQNLPIYYLKYTK